MHKILNNSTSSSMLDNGWLDITAMEWTIHSIIHKRDLLVEHLVNKNLQLRGVDNCLSNDIDIEVVSIQASNISTYTISKDGMSLFCVEISLDTSSDKCSLQGKVTSLDGKLVLSE